MLPHRLKAVLISWLAGPLEPHTTKTTVIPGTDWAVDERLLRMQEAQRAGGPRDSPQAPHTRKTVTEKESGSAIGTGEAARRRHHEVAVDARSIGSGPEITNGSGVDGLMWQRVPTGKSGMSLVRHLDEGLGPAKTTGADETGMKGPTLPPAIKSMKVASAHRLHWEDRPLRRHHRRRLPELRKNDVGVGDATYGTGIETAPGIARGIGTIIVRVAVEDLTANAIDLATKEDTGMAVDGEECEWGGRTNARDEALEGSGSGGTIRDACCFCLSFESTIFLLTFRNLHAWVDGVLRSVCCLGFHLSPCTHRPVLYFFTPLCLIGYLDARSRVAGRYDDQILRVGVFSWCNCLPFLTGLHGTAAPSAMQPANWRVGKTGRHSAWRVIFGCWKPARPS